MHSITLNDQQLDAILHAPAQQSVAVRDEQGKLRGYVALVATAEEIAAAQQALSEGKPRFSTAELLAKLRGLSSPDAIGPSARAAFKTAGSR